MSTAVHCGHSEKLPCTVLAPALSDDALGHHHLTEEAPRSKGTATLRSPARGEEEARGRRTEETKSRTGGLREVRKHASFSVIHL